eukprot:m.3616 g.3616  ORF g.3616 m.3616 type:complete len:402 (-) comp4259_c0_seq1:77-1282(-)
MSKAVSVLNQGVFIVAAQRTACGAFGGKLAGLSATDLATHAAKAAIAAANVDPALISSSTFGNVQQTSKDAAYLARHVALKAGCAIATPALTVNRLCGSGFEAVIQGAKDIVLGEAAIALTGGTESMSQAPYSVWGTRFGTKLGTSPVMEDTLWAGLSDSYCGTAMGVTAENLAEKYNISRQDCDEFALSSQQKWAAANAAGVFAAEISPVTITSRRKEVVVDVDEHPRPETTLETLAKLPTVFKKGGAVTAASSSGICDGGAALIVASEEAVAKYGLKPLARVVGWSSVGVEPTEMGIGPVPASQNLLERANLSINDMDMVEVNEAFGAQCLAVAKGLDIDPTKLNIHGGAIAIGHPLGMSGARILTHLAQQVAAGKAKRALGTACIGGGQGIAVLLEQA